jgi:hypothetical protein
MQIACGGKELTYNLRFDMSSGQPLLHVDFQLFATGHQLDKKKLLAHVPVSLVDLWSLSRGLYLAFLAAGGFDPYFDRLIEHRLEGFHQMANQNAATVYPLMLRVRTKPIEDWLRANPKHLQVLLKFAADGLNSLTNEQKMLIPGLVEQHLFGKGTLTALGGMLTTRLRP